MNFREEQITSPLVPMNCHVSTDATPKRKPSSKEYSTPLASITEENACQSSKKITPHPRNPFDLKPDSLYFHSCSPFFATLSRNKKEDGTFRWSIDQLSMLCPADIDESSLPEPYVDSDQEKEVQEAIDTFFSQNSIVPSPWSDSPSDNDKTGLKLRRASQMICKSPNINSYESATQTALSIPPDVDLKEILGKYFTFNDEEDVSSCENSREEVELLSASSLRRKLFMTDEECISPPRVENRNLYSAKLWSTPTSKMSSAQSTPLSDVLSSSPISPPNCSESCNILSPPPVSPIAFNHCTSAQMKSFNEQSDSEIYYSPENLGVDQESAMSFLAESQEAPQHPTSASDKQDTGYVTGSISSSQNMNFSEGNYGFVSRITPVAELMEGCELSNLTADMSCRNVCLSNGDSLSFDGLKNVPATSYDMNTYPWLPTCSSTPAPGFHNVGLK